MGENQAQTVLHHDGDPQFVMLQMPYLLSKQGRAVIGTFFLENAEEKFRSWLVGPYYRCLGAFMLSLKPEDGDFLLRHSEVARFVDRFEAEKIRAVLDEKERSEPWLAWVEKQEKQSLSWEDCLQSPFSSSEEKAVPLLPENLLRRQ